MTPPAPRERAYARHLAALLRGVDALYRAALRPEPQAAGTVLAAEGLIAVDARPVRFPHLADWSDAIRAIGALGPPPPEAQPDRRRYLEELRQFLLAVAEAGQKGPPPFGELLRRWLAVDPSVPEDRELDRLAGELRSRLQARGLAGALDRMVATWLEDHRLPEERILPLMEELMAKARRDTEALLGPFPAGTRELTLRGVSGAAYHAYVDLLGGAVEVNLDVAVTLADLRHLVAHEAYPGHYTYLTWHLQALDAGLATEEAALVVTSSPMSALFEGVGEYGLALLGWPSGETPDLAIGEALIALRSAAAARAAFLRHGLGLPAAEVRRWLAERALADPGWLDARTRFLELPLRRAFLMAYWAGRQALAQVVQAVPPGRRGDFLKDLYARPHSVGSLREAWGAS